MEFGYSIQRFTCAAAAPVGPLTKGKVHVFSALFSATAQLAISFPSLSCTENGQHTSTNRSSEL